MKKFAIAMVVMLAETMYLTSCDKHSENNEANGQTVEKNDTDTLCHDSIGGDTCVCDCDSSDVVSDNASQTADQSKADSSEVVGEE